MTNTSDNIAVVGYGITGQSVARYLSSRGVRVVVLDTRPEPASVDRIPGVDYRWLAKEWPLLKVDRAIVSPGLSLDTCLLRQAARAGVRLESDIDLFFEAVDGPVFGITGTNGKSTVTSLVGHLLNADGVSCAAGGNLGDAALDLLEQAVDAYALELSSFQLERSGVHPFAAATILNVSEDHLDHHGSMQSYVASKHRIYADAALRVFNRDDPATYPEGVGPQVSFGVAAPRDDSEWGITRHGGVRWIGRGDQLFVPCHELSLAGAHNELNVMAALAMVQDRIDPDVARAALNSFKGLSHRFEVVLELEGVTYINDSKATNVGSTVAALEAQDASDNIVLIAGGDAKGVDLTPLSDALRGRVKFLVAIGADADQLERIARDCEVLCIRCESMASAVDAAAQHVSRGDTVLLSPACASLDMFDNYADRGNQFAAAVHRLAKER